MTHPALDDALATLHTLHPTDPRQVAAAQAALRYVSGHDDAHERTSAGGAHLTVSAVVLDADLRILWTFHPKFSRWQQLGGHLEPGDRSLAAAALRETREESGLEHLLLDPVPLGVFTFEGVRCPRGRVSTHLDITYLVRTPSGAAPVRSTESVALEFFPAGVLPAPADAAGAWLAQAAWARATATPNATS